MGRGKEEGAEENREARWEAEGGGSREGRKQHWFL